MQTEGIGRPWILPSLPFLCQIHYIVDIRAQNHPKISYHCFHLIREQWLFSITASCLIFCLQRHIVETIPKLMHFYKRKVWCKFHWITLGCLHHYLERIQLISIDWETMVDYVWKVMSNPLGDSPQILPRAIDTREDIRWRMMRHFMLDLDEMTSSLSYLMVLLACTTSSWRTSEK